MKPYLTLHQVMYYSDQDADVLSVRFFRYHLLCNREANFIRILLVSDALLRLGLDVYNLSSSLLGLFNVLHEGERQYLLNGVVLGQNQYTCLSAVPGDSRGNLRQ